METKPRPLRVLIVDDHIDFAESTAILLRLQGHEVATAYTPTTALMAARARHPDVVLIDIDFARADGCQLAEEVVAMLPNNPLLIAISDCPPKAVGQPFVDQGFDHHLNKPLDGDALGKILGQFAVSLGKTSPPL